MINWHRICDKLLPKPRTTQLSGAILLHCMGPNELFCHAVLCFVVVIWWVPGHVWSTYPYFTASFTLTVRIHYNDVIMDAIAFQITSLVIVYLAVHSDADQRKYQSSASLAFVRGIHLDRWIPFTGTGEFPAQMASNAEKVSIWWRHHAGDCFVWCHRSYPEK